VYRMSVVLLVASELGPRIRDFFCMASFRNSSSVARSMSLISMGNSILTLSSSAKNVWMTNRMFACSSSSVGGLLFPILSRSVM